MRHVVQPPPEGISIRVEDKKVTVDADTLRDTISRMMIRALKRRPTRRTQVYDMFIDFYVDREIRKAMGQRGGVGGDELEFEAVEFARQLALHMSRKGTTKLAQKVRSNLFTDASDADIFFSNDELARAARNAAPIKMSGGFLTFVHKTVQEHLAANAVAAQSSKTCFACFDASFIVAV